MAHYLDDKNLTILFLGKPFIDFYLNQGDKKTYKNFLNKGNYQAQSSKPSALTQPTFYPNMGGNYPINPGFLAGNPNPGFPSYPMNNYGAFGQGGYQQGGFQQGGYQQGGFQQGGYQQGGFPQGGMAAGKSYPRNSLTQM